MFLRITYALNLLLIATGVFQYFKVEWRWALIGAGVGAFNLLAILFRRSAGLLAAIDAVANLAVLTQGVILGYQSVRAMFSGTNGQGGIWDLVSTSHDFSYAIVYIGAGLCTLLVLNRHRPRRAAS